jgi:serine/threonine protein kinase
MGEVVLAMDTTLSRKVALKFLSTAVESDREYVDRIMREARIAADLNHPNIVHIYDFGEFKDSVKTGGYDGRTYISMEFIEGRSLKALLKESERLENKIILKVSLQIAEALAYAHKRNVFHRDIKPENILITTDDQVKLLDFGLAKSANVSTMTKEQVLGTPYYMSPEQADGDQNIDYRTDIFSFGIVLYELVTHERPFHGDTFDVVKHSIQTKEPVPVAELNRDAARGFQKVIDKCIAKKREDRYQSATEVIKALRREERLIEPFDGLTVRMDGPSPKDWKESLVNEAKTLRKQKESEEVKRLLSTGQRRYSRGKYDAAVESFKEVIAINPEHPEANEYLEKIRKTLEHTEIIEKCIVDGEFYLSKKKYEEATELFERALKIDPNNKAAKKGLQRGEQGLGIRSGASLPWLLPRVLLVVVGLLIAWFAADYFSGSESTPPITEPLDDPILQNISEPTRPEPEPAEEVQATATGDIDTRREGALRAREEMREEKQAALKANAANFAGALFTSALAKEDQGNNMVTSSDPGELVIAEQHFRDATDLFVKAAREARRQQALLVENRKVRDEADAERAKMLAEKGNVPATGRSANSDFSAGQTFESNGNAEYERGDYTSASSSYRRARARYSTAAVQLNADASEARQEEARRRTEAENAKSVFDTKAKKLVELGEPDWQSKSRYASLRDRLRAADDAYRQGEYQRASQLYTGATAGLDDIIVEAEGEAVIEQDRKAIARIIGDFKSSLENGNFQEFKRIVPLDKGEEQAMAIFFQSARNIKVDLINPTPAISGTEASLDMLAEVRFYNTTKNAEDKARMPQKWLLKKSGGAWSVISK